MMHLKGKKIFITGASRGIGKAIALKLAAEGGDIAFTYCGSDLEAVQATEAALSAFGVQVKSFHTDAADFQATDKAVADMVAAFGGLDVLINNAGITRDNLLLRMPEADWDAVLNVNLKSVFNTVKASLKTFLKQRSGSIINIASIVGISGHAGQANYAASKAGMIGLTKSIALELGSRNIRANVIAPGFIATAMTDQLEASLQQAWMEKIPLKRVGCPEDVANCALFLASDASSYITGQVIQIDGGLLT
ncbi:MAG: 3-oxoacyl-[acyl-carrier-protein] reductase [Candidatus Cardinium sp.]|uniref:3-oxoacyl-[acyl-carrier-protein] reductase n=1 Tax=Cardinium endosymbiont of Dermatophagoides farinae TaxID=2597823 RepID=UPI0011841F11|nr:3-oxoacyl-[acyl-carrier-protein] reductase [Cardinium endosymbiont of Dermatophagoides farinae]TSJ81450.1 3-oxoacyl-[acyl-carrier-protein] reductase [Cardinium endosymbiont of Dermatophagoides farinae]UWW96429.1 MAG: 3-oxoacyl-[acyl-carrier-protein] reductase [Candidatus Cardinium sp.]